jgi:hypothetical protein
MTTFSTLTLLLRSPDGERIDEATFVPGAIIGNLSPNGASGSNGLPRGTAGVAPMSDLEGVRAVDDRGATWRLVPDLVAREGARALRQRHTAVYPDNDRPKEADDE